MQELKINTLSKLGKVMKAVGNELEWPGFEIGITKEEYEQLAGIAQQAKIFNGWFEPTEVRRAFSAWGEALTEENLSHWLSRYGEYAGEPKTVAIIMAGNIPLVGLHDLISVYLAGHKAKIKLSSDDNKLIPALLKVWTLFDADLPSLVTITEHKLENFDAVIATGSNNTSRYFEQYFGSYPNIIRKNRTSIAVLTGDETEEELKALADDVFAYFGLGCRNVTKIYLPKGYDLNKVFGGLFHKQEVVNNKKYGNNYDYHKAVFLLEGYDVLENGFILMKQDESLTSPIGTLFYDYYDNHTSLMDMLKAREEEIQCVVSKTTIPFGKAQSPALWDYADGVDTMKFLLAL
ncbi:MAG: acyl-CoA reductase [Flavobacteriales bacterium]|nr:acyl-CoA reductase [Flavobacteriales bacterium]